MTYTPKPGYFVWSTGENAFVVWNTHDPYLVTRGIEHFLEANEMEPIEGLADIVFNLGFFGWLEGTDMHEDDWTGLVKEDQDEFGSLTPFTAVVF